VQTCSEYDLPDWNHESHTYLFAFQDKYPLVIDATKKRFKKNLVEFFQRFVEQCSSGLLYEDVFTTEILNWVMALAA